MISSAARLGRFLRTSWDGPHSSAGPKLALLHPRNHAVSFGALSTRARRARTVEPETRDKADRGPQLCDQRLTRRVPPQHRDSRKLSQRRNAEQACFLQPATAIASYHAGPDRASRRESGGSYV